MENEIFERDYRITEKSKNTSSKKPNIINYAAESGFFKAYNDAMLKIPKYIVQEDKEAYEDLLFRLPHESHPSVLSAPGNRRWTGWTR